MKINIKYLVDEDYINYKKPCMFIGFPNCTFKCGKENCQNYSLRSEPNILIDTIKVVQRYIKNPLTKAIVIGGLEPFDDFNELLELVNDFRKKTTDDIVIYTGYYKSEIQRQTSILCKYKNIIIKYGRYIANDTEHYDDILGVNLISNNQYAERIS